MTESAREQEEVGGPESRHHGGQTVHVAHVKDGGVDEGFGSPCETLRMLMKGGKGSDVRFLFPQLRTYPELLPTAWCTHRAQPERLGLQRHADMERARSAS